MCIGSDDSLAVATDTVTISVEKAVAIVVREGFVKVGSFAAHPSPVSPFDNQVQFTVPVEGVAELRIYDLLGALLDYQTLSVRKTDQLSWNLCNISGVSVGSGSYVAVLKVTASNGAVQMFKAMVGVQR